MISAKVVCDSISPQLVRITTFEIEVPRIVWAEFMTHRMFSRNAASSRAIPFEKMLKQLDGVPVRFGKNVAGMQDGGEHNELINDLYSPQEWWNLAKLSAKTFAEGFASAKYHKQISGRLTEPFQIIKAVVTATEWENFFYLRDDEAADPTIAALAQSMKEAYDSSVPNELKIGEYHLPYVEYIVEVIGYDDDGSQILGPMKFYAGNLRTFYGAISDFEFLTLEEAIKVSCARCAAVSFRNVDYVLEKCIEVYDRLVNSGKLHGSALEHVATPMVVHHSFYQPLNNPGKPRTWENGVSHVDRKGRLWSGNIRGFIQHRKCIKGENYE